MEPSTAKAACLEGEQSADGQMRRIWGSDELEGCWWVCTDVVTPLCSSTVGNMESAEVVMGCDADRCEVVGRGWSESGGLSERGGRRESQIRWSLKAYGIGVVNFIPFPFSHQPANKGTTKGNTKFYNCSDGSLLPIFCFVLRLLWLVLFSNFLVQ
ncbi:hypothetical protein RYX36_019663 [Vicia faba]